MKALLVLSLLLCLTACTTLENRRDLYRSPAEGYERWYPEPPPTRKPAGPPVPASSTVTMPTSPNAGISYPEEPLPSGR